MASRKRAAGEPEANRHKRIRYESSPPAQSLPTAETLQAALEVWRQAKAIPSLAFKYAKAVKAVRRQLFSGTVFLDLPLETAKTIVALAAEALQPSKVTEGLQIAALEAAWILTNLVAGKYEELRGIQQAVFQSLPLLTAHLSGTLGPAIATQCAWTIGNLAADCEETRERLLAGGVLVPLLRLTLQAAPAFAEREVTAAARVACWALLTLLSDAPSAQVGQVLRVPGADTGMLVLLQKANSDLELTSSVAWLLTTIACDQEEWLRQLLNVGLLPALLQCVGTVLEQQGRGEAQRGELEAERGLPDACLVSCVRLLGCIAALEVGVAAVWNDSSQLLFSVAEGTGQPSLRREALWAFNNLLCSRNSSSQPLPPVHSAVANLREWSKGVQDDGVAAEAALALQLLCL